MAKIERLVLACATVIEEMLPLLPPEVGHRVLDFGLHVNPARLKAVLQEEIDRASEEAETIILGYGLCSNAVLGLRATNCTLVVPLVDDCIAIFLGSKARHRQIAREEPGSYYLTKGWIEVGDTPFSEYERTVEKYGKEKADRITKAMLAHYTRLVLIDTGQYRMEESREYAQRTAERFGLRLEEIAGSSELVKKMIDGPWDTEEFVVVPPGGVIEHSAFYR
jgi:hypothetical protein